MDTETPAPAVTPAKKARNYMGASSASFLMGDIAFATYGAVQGTLGVTLGAAIGSVSSSVWLVSKLPFFPAHWTNTIQRNGFRIAALGGAGYITGSVPIPYLGSEHVNWDILSVGTLVCLGGILGQTKKEFDILGRTISQPAMANAMFFLSNVGIYFRAFHNIEHPDWGAAGCAALFTAGQVLGALSSYLPENKAPAPKAPAPR